MRRVVDYVIVVILFGVIGVLGEYLFLRMSHTENYLDVQSVEPLQQMFSLGEHPYFVSNIIYKKGGDIHREDIQFCKKTNESDYTFYSIYNSSIHREKGTVVNKKRRYGLLGPLEPMDCYLYSTTTIMLHYGVTKSDTYISGPYYYR